MTATKNPPSNTVRTVVDVAEILARDERLAGRMVDCPDEVTVLDWHGTEPVAVARLVAPNVYEMDIDEKLYDISCDFRWGDGYILLVGFARAPKLLFPAPDPVADTLAEACESIWRDTGGMFEWWTADAFYRAFARFRPRKTREFHGVRRRNSGPWQIDAASARMAKEVERVVMAVAEKLEARAIAREQAR